MLMTLTFCNVLYLWYDLSNQLRAVRKLFCSWLDYNQNLIKVDEGEQTRNSIVGKEKERASGEKRREYSVEGYCSVSQTYFFNKYFGILLQK